MLCVLFVQLYNITTIFEFSRIINKYSLKCTAVVYYYNNIIIECIYKSIIFKTKFKFCHFPVLKYLTKSSFYQYINIVIT